MNTSSGNLFAPPGLQQPQPPQDTFWPAIGTISQATSGLIGGIFGGLFKSDSDKYAARVAGKTAMFQAQAEKDAAIETTRLQTQAQEAMFHEQAGAQVEMDRVTEAGATARAKIAAGAAGNLTTALVVIAVVGVSAWAASKFVGRDEG